MDVSIIIVNYNTKEILRNCLNTITKHTKNIDYEVIIIDNASTDDSVKMLSTEFPQFILIKSDINLGFGKANNEGFKIAKGRNYFLLNPDTLLQNNAVKILSDFIDSDESYAVCGGNLLNADETPQPSFSMYFHSIKSKLSILFYFPNRKKYSCNFNYSTSPIEVAVVFGSAFMIKSRIIKQIGGFNPNFFLYAEEDELCYRIKKAKYKIMNYPKSRIIHLDGSAFDNSLDRQNRRIEGLNIFYSICYSPIHTKIIRFLDFNIILSRLIVAWFLRNEKKLSFWKYQLSSFHW